MTRLQHKTKRADVWACLYAAFFGHDTGGVEETDDLATDE